MQQHCMAYMNDGFCSRPNCQYLHKGAVESNEFEFLYFWNFKLPTNPNYYNQMKKRRFPDHNPSIQVPTNKQYLGTTTSDLQAEKERIRNNRQHITPARQIVPPPPRLPKDVKIKREMDITNEHPDSLLVNDITNEDILKDGFLGSDVDIGEAMLLEKWKKINVDEPDVPFVNGTAVSRSMRKEAIKSILVDFQVQFDGNRNRAVAHTMEEESKLFGSYKMSTNAYMSSVAGLKKRIREENMKK